MCKAITKNKLKKEVSLMVGDTPDDIEAGHKAGIEAVRIRTGRHCFEEPKNKEQTPEAEYNSLGDMLELYQKDGFK